MAKKAGASQPSSSTENPGIAYVFTDNSNVFNGALTAKHNEYGFKIGVDYGKLLDIVRTNCEKKNTTIANDPDNPKVYCLTSLNEKVRQKIKDCGWEVLRETDPIQKMSTDIDEIVENKVPNNNDMIVVISGDAEMIQPIEKAIDKGWKVEVYLWDRSLASALREKGEKESKCEVYLLDQQDIVFFNLRLSSAEYNDRKSLITRGIVCTMTPNAFEKDDDKTSDWCIEISKKLKDETADSVLVSIPPPKFHWMQEYSEKLVLLFSNISEASTFDKIVENMQEISQTDEKLESVEMYKTFSAKVVNRKRKPTSKENNPNKKTKKDPR